MKKAIIFVLLLFVFQAGAVQAGQHDDHADCEGRVKHDAIFIDQYLMPEIENHIKTISTYLYKDSGVSVDDRTPQMRYDREAMITTLGWLRTLRQAAKGCYFACMLSLEAHKSECYIEGLDAEVTMYMAGPLHQTLSSSKEGAVLLQPGASGEAEKILDSAIKNVYSPAMGHIEKKYGLIVEALKPDMK